MQQTEQQTNTDKIVKEGYLTKLGGFVKNWRRRWFVLKDNILCYYKTPNDNRPAGQIKIDENVKVQPNDTMQKEHCFEIQTDKRTYYMCADNVNEFQSWINALLRTAITQNPDYKPSSDITTANEELTTHLQLNVKGMMCKRCEERIKIAMKKIQGIIEVRVDIENDLVEARGAFDSSDVIHAIEEAGYLVYVS
jgi:copper chaperone CopZ